MKLTKILLVGIAVLSTTAMFAQRAGDYEEILDFSEAQKKELTHLGKGELSIGGDVRFEFQSIKEKYNDLDVTGSKSRNNPDAVTTADQGFDVEVNLVIDHKTENTWAHAKLAFDNDAGAGSVIDTTNVSEFAAAGVHDFTGANNNIALEQAYFGINLFEDGASRLDFELGRNFGYKWFDSKIQFASRFDGAFLKYGNSFEGVGDFYIKAGSFLINEKRDHYGSVGELGIMDIADTGLYVKYSYISWPKSSISNYYREVAASNDINREFQFRNSQATLGYVFNPAWLNNNETKLYGAYLVNHVARKEGIVADINSKENAAYYVGLSVGDVKVKGDWFVDVNYQSVEAQAIAGFDVHGIGIGIGDTANAEMYTDRYGNTNYKGYEIDALYAITDSLSISFDWESTQVLEKRVDTAEQQHSYKKFEIETIYAF
ncbi:MAG: hypothetical protein HN411_01325 [Waddliaceae bacterium]|nr:hypothetical protein [Waddliaceae bacterium]MBT3579374.1 hypothetical protein [Waddliaceae bacterium]MBT4444864.1 hypothetical protein [Waddliaceae bacterium]MBT6928815.1 hypothetical protein [Waddliaceae bacterium]MBT7461441.1 hypothetical protein [Waddliaceae bacterium]